MAKRPVRANARPRKQKGTTGMDYFTVMASADKPGRRRKKPASTDDAPKPVRRFHIPEDVIDEYGIIHEDGDAFPNPHREGWYYFIIEALKALGLDQRHPWPVFCAKVKELMNDPATKDARGLTYWDQSLEPDAEDDREARLRQNVEVLQRLNGMTPYGLRIHQIAQRVLRRRGGCIDLEVWGDKLFVRLNLQPETIQVPISGGQTVRVPVPINETRRLKTAATQIEDQTAPL